VNVRNYERNYERNEKQEKRNKVKNKHSLMMDIADRFAKLLIQAGVSKVVYGTKYRCDKGITLLRDLNIKVIKYDSNR